MGDIGRIIYTRQNPYFIMGMPFYILSCLLLFFMLLRLTQVAYLEWSDPLITSFGILLTSFVAIYLIPPIFLAPFFSAIEIYENGIYIPKMYESFFHKIKHKEKYPFLYFGDIERIYERPLFLEPGFFYKIQNEEYILLKGNANRNNYNLIQEVYLDYLKKINPG
jgi:hypothetical protein